MAFMPTVLISRASMLVETLKNRPWRMRLRVLCSMSNLSSSTTTRFRSVLVRLRWSPKQALLARASGDGSPAVPQAQAQTPLPLAAAAAAQDEAADRRALVLDAANEIQLAHEIVATEAVLDMLERRGITIPGARPGTSVGNILHKDPNWIRVSEGKYKRREAATAS